MSKISLSPSPTGSAVYTIASPAGSTDRVLTLPDAAGTLGLAGAAVARSQLPAGSVLQVVNATYAVQTDFATASYVDTGLTATITPSSATSRILVVIFQVGLFRLGSVYGELRLLRNSSILSRFEGEFGQGNANFGAGAAGTSFLDSPNTTSALVYKTQCFSSGATIQLQRNSGTSTITLLEIAG